MPYQKSIHEVAAELDVNPAVGLDAAEVARRREQYGPNALVETAARPAWLMFLDQFRNPLLIILIIGAGISGYTGHLVDAVAIGVIVMINAFLFLLVARVVDGFYVASFGSAFLGALIVSITNLVLINMLRSKGPPPGGGKGGKGGNAKPPRRDPDVIDV